MEEVRLRALHLRQDERAPPQHCGQRLQQMPQAPSNEGFANMTRQQNAGAPARSFMPLCIDDESGKMDSHRTFETACCILHTLFPECSFNQARLDEPVNPIATLTIGQGISLEVYKPAEGPGLNYGDRFGVLKVETTDLRLRSCSMLQASR